MEVRAKKSLGQHFLTDLNIARKIAAAVSGGGTRRETDAAVSGSEAARGMSQAMPDVLEIGGGMGVLTRFLLERDDIRLTVIEIDKESVEYLRKRFVTSLAFSCVASGDCRDPVGELAVGTRFPTGGNTGVGRLIEGDFLKLDLRECWPGGVRIVGNFPYNISSQIFFKVLENRDIVPEVVGMVQREVAQRIAEPPGSRTYGILSVLLQAWYDIEYLFTVNESVFSPPPKVKSAVVRLRRNGVVNLGCDEALLVRVVKAAFGQRRKMLRNALRAVFGDFGGEEHPLFAERAEKLSVAQFVELTNWVATRI